MRPSTGEAYVSQGRSTPTSVHEVLLALCPTSSCRQSYICVEALMSVGVCFNFCCVFVTFKLQLMPVCMDNDIRNSC